MLASSNGARMDKRIAQQLHLATALAAMLQEDNEHLDDESPAIVVADLLDAMARLGVHLVEMTDDENLASLAYFAHLQAPEMKEIAEQVMEAAQEAERLRGRPELN